MKAGIIILLCSCSAGISFSQANALQQLPSKIKFSSVNQLGLLNGNGGVSYDMQTINGIAKGKWSAALGVGIDDYVSRSVPLFLDIRKEFGSKANVPFLYADAGMNYTWLSQVQKEQKGLPYSSTPGLYMGGGIGVKIKTKNNIAFVMSAGYSYKQSKEKVQPSYWIMPWPLPGQSENDFTERLNSQFRRIVVRLGIQL